MLLGLLPLGTGGAEDRLLNVGFVSLGTRGGSVSAGVIPACISVGANCRGGLERAKHEDGISCLSSDRRYCPTCQGAGGSGGRADKCGISTAV
jgi:hypothetical protein